MMFPNEIEDMWRTLKHVQQSLNDVALQVAVELQKPQEKLNLNNEKNFILKISITLDDLSNQLAQLYERLEK